MKNIIINNIRKELKQNIDPKYKEGAINFFKEPIKVYGVRSKIVHQIAQKYFHVIPLPARQCQALAGGTRNLYIDSRWSLPRATTRGGNDIEKNKKQFFVLGEEMLKSNYHEEAIIVFIWTEKLIKNFDQSDFKIFEGWLNKYANNWAKVDTLCPHTINYFVQNYPVVIPKIKKWASSKNHWVRRAAAVSFISGSRDFPQKKHLPDIFWIAKKLLRDPDDLVQKGYGWMLKCASVKFQKEVFNFVMKHKKEMPRTALRYAIEKMTAALKKKAMA